MKRLASPMRPNMVSVPVAATSLAITSCTNIDHP
jgi:hypothetical protein